MVDINSDGREDIVTLNLSHAMKKLRNRLAQVRHNVIGYSVSDCQAQLYDRNTKDNNTRQAKSYARGVKWTTEFFGNLDVSIDYKIATLENGAFKYIKDQNLTQSFKMRDFLDFKVSIPTIETKGCKRTDYYKFDFSVPKLHYSDFNKDGYKDLLICRAPHDYEDRLKDLSDKEKR